MKPDQAQPHPPSQPGEAIEAENASTPSDSPRSDELGSDELGEESSLVESTQGTRRVNDTSAIENDTSTSAITLNDGPDSPAGPAFKPEQHALAATTAQSPAPEVATQPSNVDAAPPAMAAASVVPTEDSISLPNGQGRDEEVLSHDGSAAEPEPESSAQALASGNDPAISNQPTRTPLSTRSKILVGVSVAVLAFAATVQVRTNQLDDRYSSLRREELVQLLDSLNAESNRLDSEISELELTRQELESGADANRVAAEETRERIDELGIIAGVVPATGPGLEITVEDPKRQYSPAMLLDGIQELRDAGAEAIEINDEVRVVADSWVGGQAGALVVDDTPLKLPLRIDVIGEPYALEEGIRFRGGLVSQVEDDPVLGTVNIAQKDTITVSSTAAAPEYKHARPAGS